MWKPVWGFILSTAFAVALTVTSLPDQWRNLIVLTAWSVCFLAAVGWGISHWKEKRASKPQFGMTEYSQLLRELVERKQQNKPSQKDSEIWAGIKAAWEEAITLRHEWNQNDSDPPLQKTEDYLKRTLAFAQNNLTFDEIRKLDSPFEQAPNIFDAMRSRFDMVNYLWGRLLDYERHLQEIMQTFTLRSRSQPVAQSASRAGIVKPGHLKVSHDIDCVIPRTFHPPGGEPVPGIMHHLRVESVSKARVINCQAVLKRLEKNGKRVVSACNLPFKFHPSQFEGSHIKTIHYRDEQYLEVVWLPWERDAEIMVDFEFADLKHKPLDKQAKYSAFIVFTGDNIDGQEVVMDIHHEERGWDVSKRPSAEGEQGAERGQSVNLGAGVSSEIAGAIG